MTQHIGDCLRSRPELSRVWVVAELSDVRTAGGHCYFEMVEKNEGGTIVAKMRANIWNNTYRQLSSKFFAATGRQISSGIKAMVCVAVTFHNAYGMSLNVLDIDPSYTLGDIERVRREIIEQLKREGVAEYNRSLPPLVAPQKIAVISAAGTAGYGDFADQLSRNSGGYVFYPHLYPAIMQGDRAAQSIIEALEQIAMAIDFWDCVVIIRGGGATTDLLGFDNLELARAVASFPIPVVVGIGHERDFTALDYIAHTRCKTPTAVAEFLVEAMRTADARIVNAANYIFRYTRERLAGEQRRLASLASLVPVVADAKLSCERSRLTSIASTLPMISSMTLSRADAHLDKMTERLAHTSDYQLRRQADRLLRFEQLIGVLSPAATLRRGYSITRVDGKAVSSIADVAPGARVVTTLADGSFSSSITSIE